MKLKSVFIDNLYRILIPAFCFLFSFSLQAQYRIEGKVLDAQSDSPIQSFIIQMDSVEYQFSDGIFSLQTTRLPVKISVRSSGFYSFRLKITSPISNLSLQLIPEHINIQEVIVKAFNSDKRILDTPGSIALIPNRQLLANATFTLAQTVNNVPGVYMQSGSINTNRLTIRGIGSRSPYGSNKIRAYYEDIPLTNGVGETTLEDLDLEQIAGIEIIKGPSSGFYGSGLGGVLLFNPQKPVKNEFAQTVSVGSFQTIKYTEKLSVTGKNSGHSLVYSHLHSDGYRENNASNRHNLTWTSSFTKNHTKIDLLTAFIKMDAFIPSSIDLKTYQETPKKAAANWASTRGYEDYTNLFSGASIDQTLKKSWKTKVSVFGHYNQNNELRPFNILQEKNHYWGFRSVLEKEYSSEKKHLPVDAGKRIFQRKLSVAKPFRINTG